jgi:hypothetical protein
LVDSGCEALQLTDNCKDKPLHLACQTQGSCVETISILIEAYPEAMTKVDSDGWTPLAMALIYLNTSPEIIKLLFVSCSQCLIVPPACSYISGAIFREIVFRLLVADPFRTNKSLIYLQRAKICPMHLQHLVTSARQLVWSSRCRHILHLIDRSTNSINCARSHASDYHECRPRP